MFQLVQKKAGQKPVVIGEYERKIDAIYAHIQHYRRARIFLVEPSTTPASKLS